MDEIAQQKQKRAIDEAMPTFKKLGGQVSDFTDDMKERGRALEDALKARLEGIGVSGDLECLVDVGPLFGFLVGRIQRRASLMEVRDIAARLRDVRPHDPYSMYMYGADACHIIKDMHAEELWRYARLMRNAVQEIYISLRASTTDTDDIAWGKAIGVAEVFVDIMYPIIAGV